jgi:hypothetical protein
VRAWALLLLVSLLLALVFVALDPLLGFALFGSDTGEYYRLTLALVTTGHVPQAPAYAGWGFAYPDFPGLFVVAAAVSGAVGISVFDSLVLVIPALAVLSALPLYLLARRVFRHDGLALLGAAFGTIAMPRMFSIAHPAPLALGDFLVVAALWMFVRGREDPRWYTPLVPTAGALIMTHHLSSYFFFLSAFGGLLGVELLRPGSWSRRFPTRELLFLAAFAVVLFAYWFGYAVAFRAGVIEFGAGHLGPSALLAGLAALAVLGVGCAALLIRWRRAHPSRARWRISYPSGSHVARDVAIILGLVVAGVVFLMVVPLPSTSQTTTPAEVLFFAPYFVAVAFSGGSRHLTTLARFTPWTASWLGALGLSFGLAALARSEVLLPARHAEYVVIPVGLLIAVGLGYWIARLEAAGGRRAVAAGAAAVVVLFAANAAIAYPPAQDFLGFQEGLTTGDQALWGWAGTALPAPITFVTDHRLSSMLFGFDGDRANWVSGGALLTGGNVTAARALLAGVSTPTGTFPPNAVAVDATMHAGVALDPNAAPQPLSPAAIGWLGAPPFVPVYVNGPEVVYWVDTAASPPS